jgi:hypothetical protein
MPDQTSRGGQHVDRDGVREHVAGAVLDRLQHLSEQLGLLSSITAWAVGDDQPTTAFLLELHDRALVHPLEGPQQRMASLQGRRGAAGVDDHHDAPAA